MTKIDVYDQIGDFINQSERGVCPVCKKTCKRGSEKVIDDTFDVHHKCLEDTENKLVRLLLELDTFD